MKLLTLNVHAWMEEHTEEKLTILAQVIAEKAYDIIALQEVNQSLTSPFVTNCLRQDNYGLILLEKLRSLHVSDYSYYWSPSHLGYDKYEEGIAFLTRLPVYEVDDFYCSRNTGFDTHLSRKILGLTLEYQGQFVDVYSCHINLPSFEEESQLENVENILRRNESKHLKILMGDFNMDAFSDSKTYQAIKELGLFDTYELARVRDEGVTVEKAIDGWQNSSNQKRLDYVFINQKKKVSSSQVIFNGRNKDVVSDHFGVEVILN